VPEVRSLPEAVYRAEDLTLSPVTRRFPTMAAVRAYVTELTLSDWWQLEFPAATTGVVVETRSSSARFSLSVDDGWCGLVAIANNPQHRTLAVVLHELAHAATVHADGHGPIFRSAMLRLVRREMGIYAAVELEASYRRELS
jgi:putative metallohydrolase (TIGR04338 family)